MIDKRMARLRARIPYFFLVKSLDLNGNWEDKEKGLHDDDLGSAISRQSRTITHHLTDKVIQFSQWLCGK